MMLQLLKPEEEYITAAKESGIAAFPDENVLDDFERLMQGILVVAKKIDSQENRKMVGEYSAEKIRAHLGIHNLADADRARLQILIEEFKNI